MKKKILATLGFAAVGLVTLASCGTTTPTTNQTTIEPTATSEAPTATDATPTTTEVTPTATDATPTTEDDIPTTGDEDEGPDFKVGKGVSEYTPFANYNGYGKSTDYDTTDLYVNLSVKFDYSLGGYSLSGAYAAEKYTAYFIVDEENLYTKLTALCGDGYTQVNDEIIAVLKKLAVSYWGSYYDTAEEAESYWNYFTFIKEDCCEYQQLVDSTGWCKASNFKYSDLYITPYSALSYVFSTYNLASYNYHYHSYYFVDETTGEDYYALIESKLDENGYAKVDDDILRALKYIASKQYTGYNNPEGYYYMYCFIKTDEIPAKTYEDVVTNYYEILEKECGHNKYVKVNDDIKEALKYLSYSYYGDEIYWDYWCYTTYAVTGETPEVTYTQCSKEVTDETVYINLTATNPWIYYTDTTTNTTTYYSLKDYKYLYEEDYAALEALIAAYWTEQGTEAKEYTPASAEMITLLKKIVLAYYNNAAGYDAYYYGFTYTAAAAGTYTTLVGTDGDYKTLEYEDSDLYVNLDEKIMWFYNGTPYYYSLAQYYGYGDSYAGLFIKTERVIVTE